MKKTSLLLVLFLSISTFAFSQTWSPDSETISVNPTSTKVGIGISDPLYQLHLYNSLRPEFYIGNPKGAVRLAVAYNGSDYGPNTQSGDVVFVLHAVDDNHSGLFFNMNNNNNDGLSYVKFTDSDKTIMAIYNNAVVKVDGKLYAKEIEVKTNVWADYVFKPGYKLMPLAELESFIQENNHLPDVPTETEVKENGINVAGMNAKLLQKVEELTLYIIEQQKQIDELKESLEVANMN